MKTVVCSILLFALAAGSAVGQEAATVTSLMVQGYRIVGVMPSSAGPGILLATPSNNVPPMMCFVAETPESEAIVTQYCKPVQ